MCVNQTHIEIATLLRVPAGCDEYDQFQCAIGWMYVQNVCRCCRINQSPKPARQAAAACLSKAKQQPLNLKLTSPLSLKGPRIKGSPIVRVRLVASPWLGLAVAQYGEVFLLWRRITLARFYHVRICCCVALAELGDCAVLGSTIIHRP